MRALYIKKDRNDSLMRNIILSIELRKGEDILRASNAFLSKTCFNIIPLNS